jgi:hypothetical protein
MGSNLCTNKSKTHTRKNATEWHTAIMRPTYKMGDKLQCKNYRGTSIWSLCCKGLTNIQRRQLVAYEEESLRAYQRDFRQGQLTAGNIFMWRYIIETFYEFNLDFHLLFIDFKQVCYSISITYLYEILKVFRVPKILVYLITMALQNQNGKVKIQWQSTTWTEVWKNTMNHAQCCLTWH